jgi:hypothetical protein
MEPVSDRKNPLEQALDLFVYAPLGLLLNADEVIPQLIEKGKQQVAMARVFGKFAVDQGQTEAGKAIAKVQEQATEVVGQLGNNRRPTRSVAPKPAAPAAAAPVTRAAPMTASRAASTGAATNGPASTTLAIPDYDSLSASQVVPRLEGLAIPELDAVRRYEIANRGRKTILNKIAQLQG